MSAESIMVAFAIIGVLTILVCTWPAGPRVERECDDHVYGAVDTETSCADLNDGRPCEVCRDETDDPIPTQIEHVDVDPSNVVGDRKIKGFRR